MVQMSRFREFLSVPGTVRLLASSLAGRLPLGMSSLALLLLVRLQTGSFATAGLTVGAFTLSSAAASPLQGILVDRVGARWVLLMLAGAQAGALTALVIAAQSGAASAVLVVVAALAGALRPPISSCVRTLWPRVASTPEVLEAAYQIDATSQEVIWTLGPLLVAAVVSVGSPAGAVVLTIGITLAGTIWFATAPAVIRWRVPPRADSWRSAITTPGLPIVLGATVLMGFGTGAVELGLPALAVRAGSHAAAGLLLALLSIGSMIGGVAYGTRTWQTATTARYPALLFLVAIGIAPLILASSLAAGIPLSLLAGVGLAPVWSCEYALTGALASQQTTTEAFTWLNGGLIAGLAAGNAVAGLLVQAGGTGRVFAIGSLAIALAGALAFSCRRRLAAAIAEQTFRSAPLSVGS